MTVRLVPLDCPSCGSALRAEPLDIVFLCDHCGGGAILGEEGLSPLEATALLPAPGRRAELWRPAWVLEAHVTVSGRIRADRRPTPGWEGDRTFVIPAFALPIRDLTRLALALGRALGATAEVPREPVTGGTLGLEDAVTLARHLVVGDEVRRPDKLATVDVALELRAHRLAAVPLEDTSRGLRCAVTGVTLTGPGEAVTA